VVILNTTDYVGKISHMLEEPLYRRLAKDCTEIIKWRTIVLLKKSSIPDNIAEQL
jgi:hypothetical protein